MALLIIIIIIIILKFYMFFPPYTFGSLSHVTRAVLCDRSIAHDINLARYLEHA